MMAAKRKMKQTNKLMNYFKKIDRIKIKTAFSAGGPGGAGKNFSFGDMPTSANN
jgi:hypothetical protein